MRKFLVGSLSVCLVSLLRAQMTAIEPILQTATTDFDAASLAGAPIPHTVFGTFLEPINDSAYNGLWAVTWCLRFM